MQCNVNKQAVQNILWTLQKVSSITFLFISQKLQFDADGGRTWLTISLCTGTFSFFKDAHNREDSLTAITYTEVREKENQANDALVDKTNDSCEPATICVNKMVSVTQ